VEVKYQ